MSDMKQRIGRASIGLGVMLVALVAWGQQFERIVDARPVGQVAERLQQVWAVPVTYEEPVWQHVSDGSRESDPLGREVAPRFRAANLPVAALKNSVHSKDLGYLRDIIEDFNRSNAPLAFAVTKGRWGLNIVASRSLNASGASAPAINVLDEHVTVMPDKRNAFGHVQALAKAISDKSGIRVEAFTGTLGFGFNDLFAYDRSRWETEWGAVTPMKARDALISLFERADTTMSWRVFCLPASEKRAVYCSLIVDPLQVEVVDANGTTGRVILQFDRCARCPPVSRSTRPRKQN